jgi:hypothetical protein
MRRKKVPPPRFERLGVHARMPRKLCSFRLSLEAIFHLETLAHIQNKAQREVIEDLLAPKVKLLFEHYEKDTPFAKVVIDTGLPPDVVRFFRKEYESGWKVPDHSIEVRLDKKIELAQIKADTVAIRAMADSKIAREESEAKRFVAEAEVRKARVENLK